MRNYLWLGLWKPARVGTIILLISIKGQSCVSAEEWDNHVTINLIDFMSQSGWDNTVWIISRLPTQYNKQTCY